MAIFLKKVTPSQEEHQVGPLGGVPEEGSSVCITVPEDLPVGLDMEVDDHDMDGSDPLSAWTNVCVCILV